MDILTRGISAGALTPGYLNLDPSLLPKWRPKLAGVLAKTGRAKILCVGDSTTAGLGAGSGGTTNSTGARQNSYPDFLGARLNALGIPTTLGSFGGYGNDTGNAAYDARVSYGAGWSSSGSTIGGGLIANSSTTNPISFTPAETFDTIDLYFLSFTNNGTFTVNVDGGAAAATINSGASNVGYTKQTVTVARGTHTINIARNGTGGIVYLLLVDTYDSTKPAVSIINVGKSGSTSNSWVDTSLAWSTLTMIGNLAPDLTILDLGINDAIQSVALATYTANMQTVIAKAKLTGDVIAKLPNPNNLPAVVPYVTALRGLAAQLKLPTIDNAYRDGNSGASGAAPAAFFFDALHRTALGYADTARSVEKAILI